jgi:hypothetical protein
MFNNQLTKPRSKFKPIAETVTVTRIYGHPIESIRRRQRAMSVLDPHQVRAIRAARLQGQTLNSLAREYGVSIVTICNLLSGKTYGWVN